MWYYNMKVIYHKLKNKMQYSRFQLTETQWFCKICSPQKWVLQLSEVNLMIFLYFVHGILSQLSSDHTYYHIIDDTRYFLLNKFLGEKNQSDQIVTSHKFINNKLIANFYCYGKYQFKCYQSEYYKNSYSEFVCFT